MMELKHNTLAVSFPELGNQPSLKVDFERTLRIPDDGKDYPLPPGFGSFPLRHIDDYAARVPSRWLARGGVLLPMWQSEALWIRFQSPYLIERGTAYPFAVKVATGKISAITGEKWSAGLDRNPQNYMVTPKQPWLDGYCVKKGIIRQFVAMPLGEGYSVEEQVTGEAAFGGLQIEVFPMREEAFERRFPKRPMDLEVTCGSAMAGCFEETAPLRAKMGRLGAAMGLAPGGRMRQEIYADPFSIHDWDTENGSRCFIHIVNSQTWRELTGERPPSNPMSAARYTQYGYPWFDYYDAELKAVEGAETLAAVKSVKKVAEGKRVDVLPDNESVAMKNIVNLRAGLRTDQVREASF